ncbi:MAG: glycosyltransferase [Synechococcus sp.]
MAAASAEELYQQGRKAFERGEAEGAEGLFWACLASGGPHGAALHYLGLLRRRQGRTAEALVLQRASGRVHPQLGWNWLAAAELFEGQGRWGAAADAFRRAALALPGEPWVGLRWKELEGLAALRGERLATGLPSRAYRLWQRRLEPRPAPGFKALPAGWRLLRDPHCQLRPDLGEQLALLLAAAGAQGAPPPDLVYGDEDRLEAGGRRWDPWFKPGWVPESFWATPWLDSHSLWREAWLEGNGLPPPPLEPVQRFAWQLRALEAGPRILALPRILAHRPRPLVETHERAAAMAAHLQRQGERLLLVAPDGEGLRLQWALPAAPPLISVVVPTRDRPDLLSRCLEGLRQGAAASPQVRLEPWVVDNGSRLQATADLLQRWQQQPGLRLQVLPRDEPFNWSRLNNAAARVARGELLLCLNNDVMGPPTPWLQRLAAQALRPAVGAVGAVLLQADGTIQHAGVVTGLGSGCEHPYRHLPEQHGVHRGRSRRLTGWGLVTGACLMLRRQLFLASGGFDPAFPVEYNDVDLCLRLGAAGYRQLVPDGVVLRHDEASTRDVKRSATALPARQRIEQRWPQALAGEGPWWPAASSRQHLDGRPREFDPLGWT